VASGVIMTIAGAAFVIGIVVGGVIFLLVRSR
jgi:hypothetical protein